MTQQDIIDTFGEWYFSYVKEVGKPPLALQLQHWIIHNVHEPLFTELTALRGVHEYTKLRLEECENFNQMQGKEGETK